LDSKTREEVEKRRAKPSPTNIYPRLVLFIGAIALVFAIWTSSKMASLRAGAVIGAVLLISFLLKDYALKKLASKKVNLREVTPDFNEGVEDLQETIPSLDKKVDLQENLPNLEEKVIESGADQQQVLPGLGKKVDLQEILPKLEEKVVDLQEMLAKLEEKEKAEKTA
jgi:hypothetical protein